ncbi:MAG: 4-(cytidine 5'-diphospho)-2-C-methyl-D-erythritol kinase [Erysipelothrix sp.]|nr:4-(cytidine 5'-diphospho)-2-C-methyl-D-erythritol kinase [Erysipelothrix sp.]
MKRKAFAKLNLSLNIVEQRPDGYHDQNMVMVPINLFDTVEIQVAESMSLETDKYYLPNDKRNSVMKAINILRTRYHFKENFRIRIVKNTPTRSGMGGGSSNAALTIRMLNELLKLDMSEDELLEVADLVETDAPFTMFGRPAQVKGTGNIIDPIDNKLKFWLFIVKPKRGISTRQLFKHINYDHMEHFDSDKVRRALETNDYQLLLDNIGNSLEHTAIKFVPEIKKIKKELVKFGFDKVVMTGSGSTVYAITQDEKLVDAAIPKYFLKYSFVKKAHVISDVREVEKIR